MTEACSTSLYYKDKHGNRYRKEKYMRKNELKNKKGRKKKR